jgi:hypothetical protein
MPLMPGVGMKMLADGRVLGSKKLSSSGGKYFDLTQAGEQGDVDNWKMFMRLYCSNKR